MATLEALANRLQNLEDALSQFNTALQQFKSGYDASALEMVNVKSKVEEVVNQITDTQDDMKVKVEGVVNRLADNPEEMKA